ncbi:hypothetical protein SAMN05421788_11464 [Filimonas lacunae]|uniref:Uncharacterized protein n=1 Tax=Filimonas lacunae TaxID=477680 RepID=A0A173MLH2_9BACT|nr:hypothetical protein [Filimonas lacunae]BAV08482.1 hypothetical protein FLA_4523 [Filimonas lacunae]SIT34001.1 hypothetical protein SAMN05421788_11464 [Filimonas lacunae]
MLKKIYILLVCLIAVAATLQAQDTLPGFTIRDLGQNRVSISWVNPYESCIQLNVQRSFDSGKNFRTFFSTPSPELPQNGIVDTKAPAPKMWYRIFYVLQGGAYFFTPSKKITDGFVSTGLLDSSSNTLFTIKKSDSVITRIPFAQYKKFRDSILYKTKDSLFAVGEDEIIIKPFIPQPPTWRPSIYIFTNREGYVMMHLPDAMQKHYKVVMYDADGKVLYTINRVKDTQLTLDKSDFIHAGWFSFDLFEDGKLKEHNKFYIAKEF